MCADGSAFLERMIGLCLATSILESRDQRLPMAEVTRARWAGTSSGGRATGVTDTNTTTGTVGVAASDRDGGRGDTVLDLDLADLVDLDMGRGMDLDHFLERHSGIWRDGLVLALVASAPVDLVLADLVGLVALDSGRVCLAGATSSMSCWTSCRNGQSMGMR